MVVRVRAFYTVGVGIILLPCAFMRLAGDHVVEAFLNKIIPFSSNIGKLYWLLVFAATQIDIALSLDEALWH